VSDPVIYLLLLLGIPSLLGGVIYGLTSRLVAKLQPQHDAQKPAPRKVPAGAAAR